MEIPGAPVSRENYEAITTQLFVDSFKAELQKSAFNFTFINFVTIIFFFPFMSCAVTLRSSGEKQKRYPCETLSTLLLLILRESSIW